MVCFVVVHALSSELLQVLHRQVRFCLDILCMYHVCIKVQFLGVGQGVEVGRGNGGIRRHHYIIMTYLKETRAQQNLMSILFCNFLFYDFMTTPLVGVATTLQLCNAHLTKCILFFSRTHAEKLYLIVCFCYPKSIFFQQRDSSRLIDSVDHIFFEGGVDQEEGARDQGNIIF